MSQAVLALTATTGMNSSFELIESRVNAVPYYRKVLGEVQQEVSGKTMEVRLSTVALALEYFVSTIIAPVAPFDRWVEGDEQALSDTEKRGFLIFLGKGGCAACHTGWRFSDSKLYDIGLPSPIKNPTDKNDRRFFFKAVGLRNIADRPPYMHTGTLKSLREVIEFYNRGGDAQRPSKSDRIHPLNLSDEEMTQLEAFLRTLSGTPTPVQFPILPR